jgi:hypothetical protein
MFYSKNVKNKALPTIRRFVATMTFITISVASISPFLMNLVLGINVVMLIPFYKEKAKSFSL